MWKIITLAIVLFILTTFIVRKVFNSIYKREYSTKARKSWGSRMYYWHFVIMISGAITTLILYVLKWRGLLSF